MKTIAVKDRKAFHYSYYTTEAYGISVKTYVDNDEVKVEKIYINDMIFENVDDAYKYLKDLTSTFTKETLLIYAFDVDKIWYSFFDKLTNGFGNKCLYMLPYEEEGRYKVEFRGLGGFVDGYEAAKKELDFNANEAEVAQAYAQMLYDDIFIPEKKFYLTAYQRSKKLIDKQSDGSLVEDWPSWSDYQNLRYKIYRGGTCFVHFPGLRKTGDYIHLDRTSAYPAELLLSQYPTGKWRYADETKWWTYSNVCWYGHFDIKFEINYKYFYLLNVYNLDPMSGEADIWLTDVDMNILQRYLEVKEIKCDYFKICDKGFLPKYYLDFVYAAYSKKVLAKRDHKDSFYVAQRKREVNALYGCLIISTETYEEYRKLSRATRPEWGIWCTAYERRALLQMVENVDYPLYGDTDSVYCRNSDKTLAALHEYNRSIDDQLVSLCERMGYDYEVLKELGTFKVEDYVIDFIANKTKQYGYIDSEAGEHIKCSGYKEGSLNYQNLIDQNLPKIMVDFIYPSGHNSIKIKKLSYVEAKLYMEQAKNMA